MTEEEFLKQMKEWDISPAFYNLNDTLKDFSYNLLKVSENEYIVFYIEKGLMSDRQIFFTYEDALDYLYQELGRVYDF